MGLCWSWRSHRCCSKNNTTKMIVVLLYLFCRKNALKANRRLTHDCTATDQRIWQVRRLSLSTHNLKLKIPQVLTLTCWVDSLLWVPFCKYYILPFYRRICISQKSFLSNVCSVRERERGARDWKENVRIWVFYQLGYIMEPAIGTHP